VSKNLDVQGILTEARSDIECVVMAARQVPPDEGGPICRHGRCSGQENRESASSAGSRSRGEPRRRGGVGVLRIRLRYLTLKLRALCWVLRRLRARPSVNATLRKPR
jgi:hypothetical protein